MPHLVRKVRKIRKGIKVAVVGSSCIDNDRLVFFEIDEFRKIHEVVLIVSGGAKGVDSSAERYADEKRIPKRIIYAQWKDFSEPCIRKKGKYGEYNALAGINRNTTIVEECDLVIAIWDRKSPGTRDTIKKAKDANKLHKIVYVD